MRLTTKKMYIQEPLYVFKLQLLLNNFSQLIAKRITNLYTCLGLC